MMTAALHMLLVEDNPAHAELIRRAFLAHGGAVQLTVARTLREARTMLTTAAPDLAIIDLLLPDGRGLELLPGDESAATYPMVMMTSHGNEQAAVEAIKTGAVDYVVKSEATLADMPHIAERALRAWGHITARKRLEAQLIQVQKMEAIGTMAGGIAHDFNNLLAAILGYTDLMLREVPDADSRMGGYLQEVRRAGLRAKTLVQQILTFSRRTEHVRVPVSLPSLLEETLAFLRPSLPETITIRRHLDSPVGLVLADPTQLQQMLLNLCTNAVQAMRQSGGTLDLRLETVQIDAVAGMRLPSLTPGPYVRLTVTDSGHGIGPEIIDRIFEPFFTTKGPGEGTGMGLALVHGIVTSYNGTVTVASTPGRGTTFTIHLPQSAPAAAEVVRAAAPLAAESPRVLFVDDEVALVRLGQAIFTQLGYEAVVCSSGTEALALVRQAPERFDLVITDQTMPRMTGLALIQELRQLRPDIPIILCTGFSYTVPVETVQRLGIDLVLRKPIDMQDLAQALHQVQHARRGLAPAP